MELTAGSGACRGRQNPPELWYRVVQVRPTLVIGRACHLTAYRDASRVTASITAHGARRGARPARPAPLLPAVSWSFRRPATSRQL